jgi:predicted transcriptional regulator
MEYGDITARKHGGNARSIEANIKVNKAWQSGRILDVLGLAPRTGKEIARAIGIEYHRISGRFKALREDGKIVQTGEKREGSNEYKLA